MDFRCRKERVVYLTAKKTSPAWKRVIMRKTVDVDTNKVIQVIGSPQTGRLLNGALGPHRKINFGHALHIFQGS